MKSKVNFKQMILSVAVIASVLIEIAKYLLSPRLILPAAIAEVVLIAAAVYCAVGGVKHLKAASAACVALAIILLIPNVMVYADRAEAKTAPQYVIHAGGRNKGDKSYLNCKQPFIDKVAAGCEYIEVDFMLSSDGRVVCTHNFEHTKFSANNRPTEAEFEAQTISGKYNPMTFGWLADTLKSYPAVKIIFDTKEKDVVGLITAMKTAAEEKDFDLFNRFIIQVYSIENYEEVKSAFPEFKEFWYTNYKSRYPFTKMVKLFEDKDDVTTLVIPKESWFTYATCRLTPNKRIAVHTVNSRKDAEFLLSRRGGGIDYLYRLALK